MINGRQKGHKFEQDFAQRLRTLGYQAVTSRSESRNLDDKGVDLVDNTPFYFQLKRCERLKPVDDILTCMPDDKVRVVVSKRSRKDAVVSMLLEDFEELLLKPNEDLFYRKVVQNENGVGFEWVKK